MLNIGNKKYRNMQEQVGWNSERIDKILEFLDGVNLSDNVVVISDMSQILTPEELEIVNKAVSFLVYDGSLYIKKSQDASEAKFDIIFSISGSSIISFNTKEITVTLSNGALGLATATYNAYSVVQVDSLLSAKASISYVDAQLALKASLSGANFSGAITAPSITEIMSGYTFSGLAVSDYDIEAVFVGISKTGNKVTFVWAGYITKLSTSSGGTLGYIGIPASIGQKLYSATIGAYDWLDVKEVKAFVDSVTGVDTYFRISKPTNTQLNLQFTAGNMVTNTKYFARYEATFLLSENLAQ